MRGGELVLCFYIFLSLASFFALYWIIRLAVRHGIGDADERRRARMVLEQYQQQQQNQDD